MPDSGSPPTTKAWTLERTASTGVPIVVDGPELEPGERVVVARHEEAWRQGVQDLAAALNDADVDDTGLNWRARMGAVQKVLSEYGGERRG